MQRSRIGIYGAGVALIVGATALAACDTDDGREMKPPTSYQEWVLQGTAPTTSSTTVALVPEITVAPITQPVIAPSSGDGSSTSNAPILPGAPIGDVTGGSSVDAQTTPETEPTLPDLTAQGLVFAAPFPSGASLDPAYTCDGPGLAPRLDWTAPPPETSELVVVVTDDDAQTGDGTDFVHWIVFGLPASPGTVGGGNPSQLGTEALNSAGTVGWTPACPPTGRHTYRFTLYALDQATELPADTPPGDFLIAIEASSFASTDITATYERAASSDS
jgi:Raf kinase inhibitor-like YbhB/YbcL family protein